MSVYTIKSSFNEDVNYNDIDLETGVSINEDAYDVSMEGAMQIAMESEMNYNAIMQAVGIDELSYYEETGEIMVYEASNVSGFFGKVKDFLKNMWEKIKAIFKKFFALFDSYVKTDKEFVNKYRQHLLKVNTRNFKYKGFKFKDDKIDGKDFSVVNIIGKANSAAEKKIGLLPACGAISNELEKSNKFDDALKNMSNTEDINELMRGSVFGNSTLTASEYTKELFQVFRSGESTKEILEDSDINVASLLNIISNTQQNIKTAKKDYTDFEKIFKTAIKDVESTEKKLINDTKGSVDNSKKIKVSSSLVQVSRNALTITHIANTARLTAMKDRNRQAKAICVALMNYKPKNESTDLGGDYTGSFLENVTMI
ncbi:MAG: hypothetical protein ACRCXT_11025 [Paraclostridium sp.]